MEVYIYWFVLGLVLLGAELATGTFYLLVMSVAFGAAGLAAWGGMGLPAQFSVAAFVGVTGTLILRKIRSGKNRTAAEPSLDAGQTVKLLAWREDGTARVYYRGAEWDAEPESPHVPRDGTLYIRDVRGNKLILTHKKH